MQALALAIHSDDAAPRGIGVGDATRLASASGAIAVTASLYDGIAWGTIAYPHGWEHRAGWRRASDTAVANGNPLLGLGVQAIEFASGMTLIDCLDVRVTRIDPWEEVA